MIELQPHKYGDKVRITNEMLLASDMGYYQQQFMHLLGQTKKAARIYLESVKAKRK